MNKYYFAILDVFYVANSVPTIGLQTWLLWTQTFLYFRQSPSSKLFSKLHESFTRLPLPVSQPPAGFSTIFILNIKFLYIFK